MRYVGALLIGLAFASHALADEGMEKPILVLDTGGHTAAVRKVLFTPDGKKLISVSDDKTVRIWDVTSGEPLRTFRLPTQKGPMGRIDAAALSPDGRTLAVGARPRGTGVGSQIYIIQFESGEVKQTFRDHRARALVTSLAFSPDGGKLASGSRDGTARIWDVIGGRCERVIQGHTDIVSGVAFSPDGHRLATASHDSTGRVWSVVTGKAEATLRGHEKPVLCVAWRPDGKVIATSSADRTVRNWAPDGMAYQGVDARDNAVTYLQFTSDSRNLLYIWGEPESIKCGAELLDLSPGQRSVRFAQQTPSVLVGALSPDNALVATSGGHDHEIYLWRTVDAMPLHRLAGRGRMAWSVAWGRDGKTIAWGQTSKFTSINDRGPLERTFCLADLEFAGGLDATFLRAQVARGTLALQQSGPSSLVVRHSISVDCHVLMLDASPLRGFTVLHDDHIVVVAPRIMGAWIRRSPEVKEIILGNFDDFEKQEPRERVIPSRLSVYGSCLHGEESDDDEITAVAPSLNGRLLLSATTDQTLRIWNEIDSSNPDNSNYGELILSLFFAGDEWIAWTPKGYYAASSGGEQLTGWHINNGRDAMASYYPASQFRKTLYRPDVIKRLLDTGSLRKAWPTLTPRPGSGPYRPRSPGPFRPSLSSPHPPLQGTGRRQDARRPGGRQQRRLEPRHRASAPPRRPPRARRSQGLPVPRLGEVRARWTVEVPPGSHRLTVQADSAVSKAISEPVEVTASAGPGPAKVLGGTLYILAVGINDYSDKRLVKLDCAVPDAGRSRGLLDQQPSPLSRRGQGQALARRPGHSREHPRRASPLDQGREDRRRRRGLLRRPW